LIQLVKGAPMLLLLSQQPPRDAALVPPLLMK